MPDRRRIDYGHDGELMARDFLHAQGLDIVAENVHCGRAGEIDLVARQGPVLVFVEVRRRSSQTFGGAEVSVHRKKKGSLRRAAEIYLLAHPHEGDCRFDLVSIEGAKLTWNRDILR